MSPLAAARRGLRTSWAPAPLVVALAAAVLVTSIFLGVRIPGLGTLAPFAEVAGLDYSAGPQQSFAPLDPQYLANLFGLPLPPAPPGSSRVRGRPLFTPPEDVTSIDPSTIHSVPQPVPFTNDAFAQAAPIQQLPYTSSTYAHGASRDQAEPKSCSSGEGTVWFRYVAARTGTLFVNTFGSQGGIVLGVFSGSDESHLTRVACALGPSGNAQLQYTATATTTYFFQIATPGRRVVFNLSPLGTMELATRSSRGIQSDGLSVDSVLSGDGRYVGFDSGATNLVPGANKNCPTAPSLGEEVANEIENLRIQDRVYLVCHQVYLFDRLTKKVELVSRSSSGEPADGASVMESMTPDARYIVFSSRATNLSPLDNDPQRRKDQFSGTDVYVRDRLTGRTILAAMSDIPSWGAANYDNFHADISADGRFVSFQSRATNLVMGDESGNWDVFVRDLWKDHTERVSVTSDGRPVAGDVAADSMSADGRFVSMESNAALVPGRSNGHYVTYIRDRIAHTTQIVSISSDGRVANGDNEEEIGRGHLSADGRYIVFGSRASNLVPGDTNEAIDIFVHDRIGGRTYRVSVTSGGVQEPNEAKRRYIVNTPVESPSFSARAFSISANGRYVAFDSVAANMTAHDRNHLPDVFVHDLVTGATVLASTDRFGDTGDLHSLQPSISGDGRYVSFVSYSSDLGAVDTNAEADIYVYHLNFD